MVTGGTGALGQVITSRLLEAGASVWIPYRTPDRLEDLRSRLQPDHFRRLHAVEADVTSEAAIATFVQAALNAHQRVDILVNGVGGFTTGDLMSTSLTE
jgi:NADP-dependent 3-hydroxy acid dehydrogenase YdfG